MIALKIYKPNSPRTTTMKKTSFFCRIYIGGKLPLIATMFV